MADWSSLRREESVSRILLRQDCAEASLFGRDSDKAMRLAKVPTRKGGREMGGDK